jgi:hypothetical protein
MFEIRNEYKWLLVIVVLAVGVYLNALGGAFVYDDKRQILLNSLIQDPDLYGKALKSDVWAFKGDGTVAASNYYRPTFVAWLIVNFALFASGPLGWHIANVLLHLLVCALVFIFLRKLELSQGVSFTISAIFAVHPLHVESVAWISGSPDLLFSLFFLSSLLLAATLRDGKGHEWRFAASVGLYVLALGSKEIALLCLPVYFLVLRYGDGISSPAANNQAMRRSLPYAAAAIILFIARYSVIGRLFHTVEDSVGTVDAMLTAPSVFIFYMRQIVFPAWISVNYPLRPVISINLFGVGIPLVLSVAIISALAYASRRSIASLLGFVIFVVTLLPAFSLSAFPSEQIVHDRYLYLPLLGFLMVVVPVGKALFDRYIRDPRANKAIVVAIVVILASLTFYNNQFWANDLSLWQHASTIDTRSAFTYSQLGASLTDAGRNSEAVAIFDRSLAIRPSPSAYVGQGQALIAVGDNDRAIENGRRVISTPLERINAYTLYQGYELLAVAQSNRGDYAQAEQMLRKARSTLPIYYATLTEKLAVVLYNQGRKQDALNELESARDRAKQELLPSAKTVFLRLGMLYAEAGNRQAAARDLNEFLALTSKANYSHLDEDRRQAVEILRTLR